MILYTNEHFFLFSKKSNIEDFISRQLVIVCGMSETNAFRNFHLNPISTAIKCISIWTMFWSSIIKIQFSPIQFDSIRLNFQFDLIAVLSAVDMSKNWLKVQVIWYVNIYIVLMSGFVFFFFFSFQKYFAIVFFVRIFFPFKSFKSSKSSEPNSNQTLLLTPPKNMC